jgi:hypothetical protein
MNDKERLQEIKEWFFETFKGESERNKHVMYYKWLISQAEKVEQLERENERLKELVEEWRSQAVTQRTIEDSYLLAENARLKQA